MNDIAEIKCASARAFAYTEKITAFATELGLDMEGSIDARMNRAIEKTNNALRLVVEAGIDFMSVKHELPHGQFEDYLNDRGITPRRAQEAMAIAQFSAALPEKERRNILALSKTKALLLAHADQEVINQLMSETNSDEITDLNNLSFRDMRERIRQLEAKTSDQAMELETRQIENRDLKEQLTGRRNLNTGHPEFVQDVRHEANALANEINLRLDEFDAMAQDIADASKTASAEHIRTAATSLAIHLRAVIARAQMAGELLTDLLGDEIGELMPELYYRPEEVSAALYARGLMTEEHEQQKRLREQERERTRPAKRGRPKKAE